jgi:hypothetical protein
MESLARISASRTTGAEPFTAAGPPAGATVADFWGWSRSDLLDNTERGVLAEFMGSEARPSGNIGTKSPVRGRCDMIGGRCHSAAKACSVC